LLLEAAIELESSDPALATQIYLQALAAASAGGTFVPVADREAVAKAARARPTSSSTASDLLLDGLARFDTDGPAAAAPTLLQAIAAFRSPELPPHDAGWRTLAVAAASTLWNQDDWHALAFGDLQRARDAGALTTLSYALNGVASVHLFNGELDAAASLLTEASNIVAATGSQYVPYAWMFLEALRGREAEAFAWIETAGRTAITSGQGIILPYGRSAAATLYNGLGRYEEALVAAQEAFAYPRHWGSHLTLHELVEAAVRTGRTDVAADAFAWLSETASASGTDWALGIRARTQALLTDGAEAEPLYREGIARLSRPGLRNELSRAHLLYGEWLRRENRRVDAREQLRMAHDMFGAVGMNAFAERARRELVATGEKVRRRSSSTLTELTAQEAEISRLAAEGRTNTEIGTQLFVSARTVEWHLRKVFPKLGITSRRQLASALADGATQKRCATRRSR
jgi:ATP/maltotriose-dependent transcriptional regulator MalT